MPLHLLGKKSWNVYAPANIARVKADEAAAAAREAAEEQRMQEIDAVRRAAILRGETPPPLPAEESGRIEKRKATRKDTPDRKRRRLTGEDDTDRDIRLATSVTALKGDKDDDSKLLKLRAPASDAPLTDHAGNINLFPVDHRQAIKREQDQEAEKERRRERELRDRHTMRFSNAAGKAGLQHPWYTASGQDGAEDETLAGYQNKDVWGNEDPRRRQREQARIAYNDPFAFMQRAQTQLKKSREDKKKWALERGRELRELRAAQEREARRERHGKSKYPVRETASTPERHHERHNSSKHKDRRRSRSRSPNNGQHRYRQHRKRSRSPSQDQKTGREHEQCSFGSESQEHPTVT